MMVVDHFEGEDVIITFEEEGKDTVLNMEGKITGVEIGGGTQSTDETFLFGGKTITFQKPREKFTVDINFVTSKTLFSYAFMGAEAGATFSETGLVGKEIRSDKNFNTRWRIILWFQPYANHVKNTTTPTIVVPTKTAQKRRIAFVDCRAVTLTTSMAADDMLKGTINFEFSSTDENGYANYYDEYTSATTTALTTFTTTAHKGLLSWVATAASAAWTGSYRT